MTTEFKKYINPTHLKPDNIVKYKEQFSTNCPNYIVLDDFFNQDTLDIINKDTLSKISFNKMHALYKAEGYSDDRFTDVIKNAPKWAFDKIDDKRKFLKRSQFFLSEDKKILDKFSQNYPILFQLLSALKSYEFVNWLFSIYSKDIGPYNRFGFPILYKIEGGDMLNPHSDATEYDSLCINIYLTENWQAENGGMFHFLGKDIDNPVDVVPKYNRAVIFDPASKGSLHWVDAVKNNAVRYSFTNWH